MESFVREGLLHRRSEATMLEMEKMEEREEKFEGGGGGRGWLTCLSRWWRLYDALAG